MNVTTKKESSLESWAYEEECHYFLRENGIIARSTYTSIMEMQNATAS